MGPHKSCRSQAELGTQAPGRVMHFHAYLALSLRQTRPFLFIDQCLEGIRRLVDATFTGPVNIGSEEMVTINQLAAL